MDRNSLFQGGQEAQVSVWPGPHSLYILCGLSLRLWLLGILSAFRVPSLPTTPCIPDSLCSCVCLPVTRAVPIPTQEPLTQESSGPPGSRPPAGKITLSEPPGAGVSDTGAQKKNPMGREEGPDPSWAIPSCWQVGMLEPREVRDAECEPQTTMRGSGFLLNLPSWGLHGN